MKQKTPKTKRADNAFVKQIFDKTSGAPLMCRSHPGDPPYQTFSLGWWDKERISYDVVMEQAVSALLEERAQAQRIMEHIDTDDARAELESRKAALAEQIRVLSRQTAQLSKEQLSLAHMRENGTLSEAAYESRRETVKKKLLEKETDISALMKQVSELETAFSSKNPWIRFYAGLNVPQQLEKAQVRAWVDRVLVWEMKTVEVVFPKKYIYWKEQLPKEWF